MIGKAIWRLAPTAVVLGAFAASAAGAQDLTRMTVRQVYTACPAALKSFAPRLATTQQLIAHGNTTLAQAGVPEPQVRRIGEAIREGDCSEAEVNSALDADEAAKPDRSRNQNSTGGPPPR